MNLCVYPDPASAAQAAAAAIADRIAAAIDQRGAAAVAVSGGSSAPPMLDALFATSLDWSRVGLWQVDERVAPDGDPSRNACQLDDAPVEVHLMPVTAADLVAAAFAYGDRLPLPFDVVHLGLGSDGHTASWPPDQPDIPTVPQPVTVTAPFNGQLRMTMTESVINDARTRVFLAVGESKADPIQRWLLGDPTVPASRVTGTDTLLFCDRAATPTEGVVGPD